MTCFLRPILRVILFSSVFSLCLYYLSHTFYPAYVLLILYFAPCNLISHAMCSGHLVLHHHYEMYKIHIYIWSIQWKWEQRERFLFSSVYMVDTDFKLICFNLRFYREYFAKIVKEIYFFLTNSPPKVHFQCVILYIRQVIKEIHKHKCLTIEGTAIQCIKYDIPCEDLYSIVTIKREG